MQPKYLNMYEKVFKDVEFEVKENILAFKEILKLNKSEQLIILLNYKKIIFFTHRVWQTFDKLDKSIFIPKFQFFDILNLFDSYKIIDWYSFIEKDFNDFNDKDLEKLWYKQDTEVYYYIKFLIKTYSWILEIYCNIDKINFYYEILEKEKYNLYEKQLDIDIYYELINIIDNNKIDFNISEFLRYAKIDDDKYKVNNIYLLIMWLSTYKRIYISRFLNFFIDSLDDINVKKTLINIINTSDNFEYSENNIYKFNKFEWNIWYLDDNELNINKKIKVKKIEFKNDNNLYLNSEKKIEFEPSEKYLISILKKSIFEYKDWIENWNWKEFSITEILNQRDKNWKVIFDKEKSIISAKTWIQEKIKKAKFKEFVKLTWWKIKNFKIEFYI